MILMLDRDTILKAKQCLIDNEIPKDEAMNVLQALCYILLDEEISDKVSEKDWE